MVGKWHLGHADQKFWPQNRGFDHFYGNLVGEVDYFTKMRGGIVDWQRDGKFFQEKTYYLPLIGDEAVKMIEKQDKNKPFFLYFASLAPHAPYQAQKADEDRYAVHHQGPDAPHLCGDDHSSTTRWGGSSPRWTSGACATIR